MIDYLLSNNKKSLNICSLYENPGVYIEVSKKCCKGIYGYIKKGRIKFVEINKSL